MNNSRYFTVPGSDRKYDRNWMLVVLLISLALTLLQVSSVNNLLPSVESAMSASESGIQMILSGYALAVGITLVPAGRLGDIFGRSSLWVIGLAIFTIASLGCGLAGTITQLNLMRVLQGIGGGFFSPQVTGLIQQYFQGKSRARAFGYMGLVVSASVAVGPLLSGSLVALLGEDPGWRYSFFINVPLGLIGLAAAWKFLPFGKERRTLGPHADEVEEEYEEQEVAAGHRPRKRRGERIDLDPVGMVMLMLAVLGIMLPFMLHGVSWRWFLLIGAFILLGLWVLWELWYAKRGHFPMVDMKMFEIRSFSYCTAISALQFLGSATIFVVLALFLQDGLGVSALMVGIVGLPNAIASGYAAVWSGKRALEHGKGIQVFALAAMLVSLLLLIAGFWGVIRLGWSIYWLILPIIPMGFGAGCMGAANQTQAMMDVPPAHGGTAGGLQQMTQRITTAIGNALVTGVLFSVYGGGKNTDGWLLGASAGLGVIALFLACALTLAIVFWKRIPSSPST
ncbi:MFS transporter [Actinomycetaceae bacterium MB13-C1-2]|nr:MFS transporter [Actinomycetaceae bacterium MB13-C1-2]